MKIVFIAEGDAANVLTEYSHCLNVHGDIKSKSICTIPHPFNYAIKHDYNLTKCNSQQISEAKEWILNSDVIIFNEEARINGQYRMLSIIRSMLGIDLMKLNKRLMVWHPGSNYRKNSDAYNTHPLRNRIEKHLYAIDLYQFSPKSENDTPLHTYQYFDFSKDKFLADFKAKLEAPKRTILHIPSNSNIKGTDLISRCITNLNLDPNKYEFKVLTHKPNDQVLEEKEKSIFYVDQVNHMGGYGVAAVEAFFRSNLVFCTTHNVTESIYKLTNDNSLPMISLTMNEVEITEAFDKYFNMTDADLINVMEAVGDWIDTQYNPNSIVERFKNILNE